MTENSSDKEAINTKAKVAAFLSAYSLFLFFYLIMVTAIICHQFWNDDNFITYVHILSVFACSFFGIKFLIEIFNISVLFNHYQIIKFNPLFLVILQICLIKNPFVLLIPTFLWIQTKKL